MATAVDLRKNDSAAHRVEKNQGKPARRGSLPPVKRLLLLVKVFLRRPFVLHLMRAAKRFGERLGTQFAAAITYFSFLSLVPILMVAFSVAGFVLSSHPELLQQLQDKVASQIPGGLSATIFSALDSAVKARFTVGIVGLVIALYSGIGWMGNVRQAVQAQWRPDFDDDQEIANESLFKSLFKNLWMLAGLGLALVVSLALSSIGNALAGQILKWLGLSNISWLHPLIVVVSIVLAIAADVLIFMWVYSVLPPKGLKASRTSLVRGSIIAAVVFEVLKFALTNILPNALSGGASAAVFGPIIGLLAFFNLVSTMVLFVAAWIATAADAPIEADDSAELPDVPQPAVVVHEVVSRPTVAGLVGFGALLGFGWARRRRRR